MFYKYQVCERKLWEEVYSELNLPSACANPSIALRRIYHRYLCGFERCEHPILSEPYINQLPVDSFIYDKFGYPASCIPATPVETIWGIGPRQRLEASFSLSSSSEESVSRLTRTSLSNIQDATLASRTSSEADTNVDIASISTKDGTISSSGKRFESTWQSLRNTVSELLLAEHALASGLPNEVDMALNSLLILSASVNGGIRLSRCRNLLALLLASVGIHDNGKIFFLLILFFALYL
ncbi:unnamed protein product [Protopolystoma xenopodis]|uniref:ARID domain-containing protein n=1 Tax=Protopolystoma xenopodis TaxID=117903 RepID=A0A3S5CM73_9PLAT|nr:unnamed protein product [Protopolystoma xenopodis]